jgi:hypothetical protein
MEEVSLYDQVPIGSKWLWPGRGGVPDRHVEVARHVWRDGGEGLREKDLKTGKLLVSSPVGHFLRKAVRTDQ